MAYEHGPITSFLKSGRASVKIDGQRVSLSPDGIAKVRAERARRVRYDGGLADDARQRSEPQERRR
jgi:hypothetical protein